MQKNLSGASVVSYGRVLPSTSGPTPFAGTMFYLNSDVEATEGEYIFNLHGANTWDRITSPMRPENFVKKIGDVMSGQLSFIIKGGGHAINILADTPNTGSYCGAINWSDKTYNYSGIDTVINTIGGKGELIFSTLNAGTAATRVKINELGVVTPSGARYWNAENDGSGSGLDADLLDGNDSTYYKNASNLNTGTISAERLPYPPVHQGGVPGLEANTVYIGWMQNANLGLQVDNTFFGVNWPINANTSSAASKLISPVTIALSGGVTGTPTSFDGSGNINIPVTNIDGSFVTGELNINTSGNAASANKLATGRRIGGVMFDGTVDISLPGVNIGGNQDTTGTAAAAGKLTNSSIFYVDFNSNDFKPSYNGTQADMRMGYIGILPVRSGGTGNANGTVMFAERAYTADAAGKWSNPPTFTIGGSSRVVDGQSNVDFPVSEIIGDVVIGIPDPEYDPDFYGAWPIGSVISAYMVSDLPRYDYRVKSYLAPPGWVTAGANLKVEVPMMVNFHGAYVDSMSLPGSWILLNYLGYTEESLSSTGESSSGETYLKYVYGLVKRLA